MLLASCSEQLPETTSTIPNDATSQISTVPQGTALPASELPEPYLGIWVSKNELARLPTSGAAWDQLQKVAQVDPGLPDLSNKDQNHDIYILAKALVYARTGETKYRDEVVSGIVEAMGTESTGRSLALSRNLVGYVIAADLVDLPADINKDRLFRAWLRSALIDRLPDGRTLQSTHEERANNWGSHAGASRAAVAVYLGDFTELERTATVFHGYLGNRSAYSNFNFGSDLSWICNPDQPVSINPKGCSKDGYPIDGALPEEMRRGGQFQWPPKKTNYPWGALQGALVQAEILHRAGYPAWEWEDRALLRAAQFLYDIGWEPEGDDEWQPWLLNYAYGTSFPTTTPARPGKNMGWTDWTHSQHRQVLR